MFAAGSTTSSTRAFAIDPTQDEVFEGDETVVLGATVSGHTVETATFTIEDDDDAPDRVVLSFSSVGEGAGSTTSAITAKLANSDGAKDQDVVLTHDVIVTLAEGTDGSATSGTDYTALGTLPTVTIRAGQNSRTVSLSIEPLQDSLDEGTGETISFTATAATDAAGVTLTVPAANLTITDDDATPTVIRPVVRPGEPSTRTRRATTTATWRSPWWPPSRATRR